MTDRSRAGGEAEPDDDVDLDGAAARESPAAGVLDPDRDDPPEPNEPG